MNVIAPGPVLFMPEKRPAPPTTRRLTVTAPYEPNGDQPRAIGELVTGLQGGDRDQVLLGVTGSGNYLKMVLLF